jgi:hypothetical protein
LFVEPDCNLRCLAKTDGGLLCDDGSEQNYSCTSD